MNYLEPQKKKKPKVDIAALQSEFKRRLPSLDIAAARNLLDMGYCHVDEIRGRSPEALFDSVKRQHPETPIDRLWAFRMLVYFAETNEPEPRLLQPHMWQ